MSSASLVVAHRAHPDSARIAAISAAIALNLAVVVIASRPITPAQVSAIRQLSPVQLIHWIDPPAVLPPPPPIEMKPLKHPPAAPLIHRQPLPISPPAVVPNTVGHVAMPPAAVPSLIPANPMSGTAVTGAPVEASLAYRTAPLHFPARAVLQRMHGTVVLRVLVDETGKPVQVTVEQGSGYALLDRSASEQVMASWRFQPAMVDGHAVRALARVPVTFNLRE